MKSNRFQESLNLINYIYIHERRLLLEEILYVGIARKEKPPTQKSFTQFNLHFGPKEAELCRV